jgi:hypothetical protein
MYDDVPYDLIHESSKGPIAESKAMVGGDAMVGSVCPFPARFAYLQPFTA